MTLPPLKLVLTAVGCPGASTLIRMLKANGEREIVIHGVDMRPDAIGRFLCDGFGLVPSGGSPEYVPALLDVVRRERPNVLLVQSSERGGGGGTLRSRRSAELGAVVLVAGPEAIAVCNDKAAMHAALQGTPVLQPRALTPASVDEFVAGAHDLGYPGAPVCFKPPVVQGLARLPHRRGRRRSRVTCSSSAAAQPRSRWRRPPELWAAGRSRGSCSWSTSTGAGVRRRRASSPTARSCSTRSRPARPSGPASRCRSARSTSRSSSPPLATSAALSACDTFVSIQFIGDRLIEVNPRVSTFVYQEDFILPYLGIKYALGELDAEDVALAQSRVRTSRRSVRYFDQVFWDE